MRKAQIIGCHRRKRPLGITRQDPRATVAPDRVDRRFVASAPNQLWVAEVTYLPTVQGWLHPVGVTDVLSRMIVSGSMASHPRPTWSSTPSPWQCTTEAAEYRA